MEPILQPTSRHPITVSELIRGLKRCLNDFFPDVWVRGEVKQFTIWQSRHWYFTIKDSRSHLKCVMYAGRSQHMDWKPEVGDEVFLKGKLNAQASKGELQLEVRQMQPLGQGIHQRRVEALKRKLLAEGALDPRRKRELPRLPRAVGIVTSKSGAVLHDIRKGFDDRFPNITLLLASCRVEGQHAPHEIARAIALLNEHGLSEVIIVARGGGSRQALAAFDEEIVARAILASAVPVVSAVGHQTDHSIADLVADHRAETPSKAAMVVVPDKAALHHQVTTAHDRLQRSAHQHIARRRDALARTRLPDPRQRLAAARQRLDAQDRALRDAISRDLMARRSLVTVAHGRLRHPRQHIDAQQRHLRTLAQQLKEAIHRDRMGREQLVRVARQRLRSPLPHVLAGRQQVDALEQALHTAMARLLDAQRTRLAAQVDHLSALSPLAVLSRGYALAMKDGHAVRSATTLSVGDRLALRLAEGEAVVVVESTS